MKLNKAQRIDLLGAVVRVYWEDSWFDSDNYPIDGHEKAEIGLIPLQHYGVVTAISAKTIQLTGETNHQWIRARGMNIIPMNNVLGIDVLGSDKDCQCRICKEGKEEDVPQTVGGPEAHKGH
jgi:hypothetical protein